MIRKLENYSREPMRVPERENKKGKVRLKISPELKDMFPD